MDPQEADRIAEAERDRGRLASRPTQISRRGWKDIAVRVRREVMADKMSIIAAGVAFYGFLSLFPELNAEMEHQTARDTTVPGDRPIGQRHAEVADTLGDKGGT